jgi:leucyl aminopeptidase (aminopeptidase T)
VRLSIVAKLLTLAVLATALPAAAQTTGQNQQFADVLATQLLGVKAGQVVVITADPTHADLAEDISTSISAAGASPMIVMFGNRLSRLYYERVPARYDSVPPKALLKTYAFADALILIDTPFDPSVLAGVPPSRTAAQGTASAPLNDLVLKRNLPTFDIGNGVLPSSGTAAQWGVSVATLSSVFYGGLNVDYAQLHDDARAVASTLSAKRKLHITSPNGTDLRLTVTGAPADLNDGTISAADRARGGAALEKQLPAGDVYFLPVPGSASGKLVFGDTRVNGTLVSGLTLRFVNGKATAMTAKSGLDAVMKFYAVGGTGRDRLGFIDIGTNRAMHVSSTAQWGAGPSMAAGFVTIGIGANYALGGDDRSTFGFSSNVPTPSVTAGGTAVVNAGSLASQN